MLRFLTSGESHGMGVTVIIEGLPANLEIRKDFIQAEMAKRQKGSGSGGRMLIENDEIEIVSGVRFGKTIGSPVTIWIQNKDSKNWGNKMSTEPQPKEIIDSARVTQPRPGHVDLPGVQKYKFDDVRNVLERASARETSARVAAGAVFKQLLLAFDIQIASHTLQIGSVRLPESFFYDFEAVKKSYEKDPETRCINSDTALKMKDLIKQTRKDMDTLGGIVETWAINIPAGLGSYVHWDRKIDGQIAHAIMSIQSVKAVSVGDGVLNACQFGSKVHDEIYHDTKQGYFRKTNRGGGMEGGVTNGMPVIVQTFHKPISTLYKPMNSVNIQSKQEEKATVERSDICIVPRGAVVSEAMLSYVIASNLLEKFGRDEMSDIHNAYQAYKHRIKTQ